LNIVICDDERSRRDGWKDRLESLLGAEHSVELLDDDFKESFHELTGRREGARRLRAGAEGLAVDELPEEDDWGKTTAFDHADVLLVDYDLFEFQPTEYLTGAIVAYMARCYSGCGVIVGVNELGRNPFDLTLIDNTSSFADLTIGDMQLDNPGLWHGTNEGSSSGPFRPWCWPALIDAAERQARRSEEVLGHLDRHVLEFTGLTPVKDHLPRSSIGWLERAGETEKLTSLEDLARGGRLGYRRGDEAPSHRALARVAAARVAKWMETAVLPLQDVLIDAPHLIQRNAALLDVENFEDPSELEGADWNVTTRIPAAPEGCGLRAEVLPHKYIAPDWLSRPTFYWPKINTTGELPGVDAPYRVPVVDRVFCEDLSAFLPRNEARRFVSKLDSSAPTRWIADPETSGHRELAEVDYQPMTRLAM
jgi:hypothetical protein